MGDFLDVLQRKVKMHNYSTAVSNLTPSWSYPLRYLTYPCIQNNQFTVNVIVATYK